MTYPTETYRLLLRQLGPLDIELTKDLVADFNAPTFDRGIKGKLVAVEDGEYCLDLNLESKVGNKVEVIGVAKGILVYDEDCFKIVQEIRSLDYYIEEERKRIERFYRGESNKP
jgi:hypothetical protein